MRVIVTGDRHWQCADLAEQVVTRLLVRYGPDLVVVHGAATGVDSAFADACREIGVDHEPHPAAWDKLHKAAGPIRNQEMVDAGADLCIAVHRNLAGSRGTADCVRRALAAGIPVWLIADEDGTPKRITTP